MSVHMYIYIYVKKGTYTYIRTYIHTYIHTFIHALKAIVADPSGWHDREREKLKGQLFGPGNSEVAQASLQEAQTSADMPHLAGPFRAGPAGAAVPWTSKIRAVLYYVSMHIYIYTESYTHIYI